MLSLQNGLRGGGILAAAGLAAALLIVSVEPSSAGLFSWIIVRTLVLNLVRGGITWRGTFYPLKELKKNRV